MNNGNDERDNSASPTEEKKSVDSLLIEELTKLIKPGKEKGKTAWTIGQMLSKLKTERLAQVNNPDSPDSVKSSESNFDDYFESFVSENLGLSKKRAEQYMEIFNGITDSDLITKKMAISHLEQVIRLKDDNAIKDLLKDLAKIENENPNSILPYTENIIASIVSQYKNYLQKQSNNKTSDYNLSLFSDDSSESNKNEESTEIGFNFIEALNTERSDYESRSEQIKKQRSDIWGQDIKTSYFPEIENIYSREPIDEQGLVGLFCTIFPLIKSKKLNIKCLDFFKFLDVSVTTELSFLKIKGIRTRFPDAIIEFTILDRKSSKTKTTELFIEFEFESFNYVRHKHYESQEKCHLIVCWKHEELSQWENWKKFSYNKTQPLPFILSVENLLETGEINLINLNKS
ncbi:hypothetical protein [Microcoleus sp. MON2_D5]|uniref:hypothetical protein n=1 Tax=Microcoleus sp. MON2_D5 TaxID=2818833 RepID=UPI002FD42317